MAYPGNMLSMHVVYCGCYIKSSSCFLFPPANSGLVTIRPCLLCLSWFFLVRRLTANVPASGSSNSPGVCVASYVFLSSKVRISSYREDASVAFELLWFEFGCLNVSARVFILIYVTLPFESVCNIFDCSF